MTFEIDFLVPISHPEHQQLILDSRGIKIMVIKEIIDTANSICSIQSLQM